MMTALIPLLDPREAGSLSGSPRSGLRGRFLSLFRLNCGLPSVGGEEGTQEAAEGSAEAGAGASPHRSRVWISSEAKTSCLSARDERKGVDLDVNTMQVELKLKHQYFEFSI